MGWDVALLEALAGHRTEWADAVAQGLMDAGQPTSTYVAAAVLALVFAWVFRAWRSVAAAMLASVVATVIAEYAKEFIGRPRPPAELALVPTDGFAMPSSIGALTAGAATPLILWGLRSGRRTAYVVVALLVAGTVLVGASMVYLGAHWLSDVLAGWLLGAALGLGASLVLDPRPAGSERRLGTARGPIP
ncbi:phosphatase PAP2 family protein [Blastococcus mobilis]|uniref:Undecaprenyl-diphosphatase n=1 Tax=Blastococcus mobilis TaxID=1938746 RepID=A0A238Z2U2_9ACTN|nr:phosphatase PAP2 family protein [Blastococcus mobilis]SNR77153.1 undecaprenyl-diphosphatase [Blastococcus mobilis]